jgi:hypothetical protein
VLTKLAQSTVNTYEEPRILAMEKLTRLHGTYMIKYICPPLYEPEVITELYDLNVLMMTGENPYDPAVITRRHSFFHFLL